MPDEKIEVKTEDKLEVSTEADAASTYKDVAVAKEANSKFDDKLGDDDNAVAEKSDSKKEDEDNKAADDEDSGDEGDDKGQDGESSLDETLLDRATESGMSREQAEKFSSNEDLENALGVLEARQKEKSEQKKEDKPKAEEKPYDCGLKAEEYDEGLIAAVNKLGNDFEAKLKAQKEIISSLIAERDRRADESDSEWFDGQLAGLGEDFEDVLGKGTIKEIDQKSSFFTKRKELRAEVARQKAGYEATGQKVPSIDRLFEMSVLNLFTEKIKQKGLSGVKARLEKRATQVLGRSTTKSSYATKIDKAVQANRDFDSKLA